MAAHRAARLAVADLFRYAVVPLIAFGLGLLALAVLGVVLAARLRHDPWLTRIGAILTGLGLVTFLPQFFGPGGVRIAHGVVLGVGLVVLAVGQRRLSRSAGGAPARS